MIGVILMNNTEIFNNLLSLVIRGLLIPIVPTISAYLISLIKNYTSEIINWLENEEFIKYKKVAELAIHTTVASVYQTDLEDIYKRSIGPTEAEIVAGFNMMKEKSKTIISEAVAHELGKKYQNLDKWLENKISYYLNQEILDPFHSTNTNEMEVI